MAESIELRTPPVVAGRWSLRALPRERALAFASLLGVVSLSLLLNAWHLSHNAYGNTYYAAAVRSMTASWSNFFFGAFDPGGFITVDKPPVFLWFGALSARVFGYSSWSILLPSAVAGTATVALLWTIVRKYFGVLAGTIAGLALALSPISVAVDRLNLPEPFLILFLGGAASAVLQSIESRRWWVWTAIAGTLVGVAFNTKMLAAWIPGPALALAIVAAYANVRGLAALRNVAARLAILAGTTFVVSASWMLIVDAVPASSRPYIGGSKDNTVQNLVVDYNGVGRVEGETSGPGGARPGNVNRGNTQGPGAGNTPPAPRQQARPAGGLQQARPAGGFNGAGGIIAGRPELLRMFDDANGPEVAWLLPFALLGAPLCLWRWRREPVRRAAVVLWLGWVLLFGGVFSCAHGIYHSYYTSALVPGIAALVGMTVAALVPLVRQHWGWLAAPIAITGITAAVQLDTGASFSGSFDASRTVGMAVVAVGLVALAAVTFLRRPLGTSPALASIAVGLMVIPGSWTAYEATHTSMNTTLPQAGPREGAAGRSFGSAAFDSGTSQLGAWLNAHKDPSARWDLAVTSAQNASMLIAEYNLSVMAIGGFSGSDPSITADQFADMVDRGEVRYVMVSGGFAAGGPFIPGFGIPRVGGIGARPGGTPAGPGVQGRSGANRGFSQFPAQPNGAPIGGANSNVGPSTVAGANAVMSAVRQACQPVTDRGLPAQYQGAIYDCAGSAAALRGQ